MRIAAAGKSMWNWARSAEYSEPVETGGKRTKRLQVAEKGVRLAILNPGCLLCVGSGVFACEADLRAAWSILPVSAVAELTAVTLFALNLGITLMLPPPRPPVARDVGH